MNYYCWFLCENIRCYADVSWCHFDKFTINILSLICFAPNVLSSQLTFQVFAFDAVYEISTGPPTHCQ